MSDTQNNSGITLLEHPDRLSDDDLDRLANVLGGALSIKAAKFSAWLSAWISNEQDRRIINQTAETPIEATMPQFNAARWSNNDVADALNASFALVVLYNEHNREVLRDFTATLHKIVSAWAAHRLRSKSGGG